MSTSVRAVLREIQTTLTPISDAPMREAEWLMQHVTGFSRQRQRQNELQDLSDTQRHALQHLVQRRAAGEPLAYLLGEQHFWTLRLKVNQAVLIPRPETELVVERALHHLQREQATHVLDLGTGSGAIALAVAQERPNTMVLAVDESTAALAIAQQNATLNQLGNVRFLRSDWFNAIAPQRFALILANPPYIAKGDAQLETAVLAHEPHQALFADQNGLGALRRIIDRAPDFLAEGGWLILEHGWQQASAVRQLLESAGLTSVASHADLAGHERVSEARRHNLTT